MAITNTHKTPHPAAPPPPILYTANIVVSFRVQC
jgi:hypothetical protein